MKERIEKFQEVVAQYTAFKDEFDSLVRGVAIDYAIHKKKLYPHIGFPRMETHLDDWELDNDGDINFKWSETWGYGGHDGGEFSFPISYLVNKAQFDNFKALCIKEEQEREAKAKQYKLDVAKRELERLKKELGQA
jgi:hypothetical protein